MNKIRIGFSYYYSIEGEALWGENLGSITDSFDITPEKISIPELLQKLDEKIKEQKEDFKGVKNILCIEFLENV